MNANLADNVESRIKKLIVDHLMRKIDPHSITDDENLMKGSMKLGSPELMEIVVGLEEVFNISVEDNDFDTEKFSTVKKIADVVRKKLAAH